MRALIVEDATADRDLVVKVCGDIGVDATGVASAEEALAVSREAGFDLYIVDLHLGRMDGLELCRQLRKIPALNLVPIILLTADRGDQLQQRAFDAGISEIIIKTEAPSLHEALRAFIGRIERKVHGRVLYVEDSRAVAELTLAYLRAAGLEVDHFAAADAALKHFGQNACDLVISDIVVEGSLSGIGLLRAIRARGDQRGNTPFLALSGSGDTQRRVLALRQGADDFIGKPVHREELIARSANLIAKKRLMDQVLEQQKELKLLAITDELSGLYNKAYLNATAHQMLAYSIRHRYPMSLIIIDLDHFKRINDEHGHAVGDKVLKAVGHLLKTRCREEDLAARFGGEEFIVVLPHCSLSNARNKAEFLRTTLEELRPAGLAVTASFGVCCTQNGESIEYEEFFRQADQALYQAKEQGRNRVVCFAPALDYSD